MGKQRGSSEVEGILILAVILIIMILGPDGNETGTTITSSQGQPVSYGSVVSGSVNTSSSLRSAPQSQNISIGSGNAAYAYQSYEEYITIENWGDNPVNITGWQLKNGKDKRPYYQAGGLQRFSADVVIIPRAAKFISPSGNHVFQDAMLKRGERAIVTTGGVGVRSPYEIVSFKENICSGYIERLPDYAFTPPLSQSCPRPDREPGIENLDVECRRFLSNLSACETPRFDTRTEDGEICTNCINGRPLSGACVAFAKDHYNYGSCIAYHAGDADFESSTWRIFLGRGWEMWATDYETIELFNNLGQLVDFQHY